MAGQDAANDALPATSRADPLPSSLRRKGNLLTFPIGPGGYYRMLLSRRQIIEAGAAAGALSVMSSPLLAAAGDPISGSSPYSPYRVPAQSRVRVDPVLDPRM